MIDMLFVIILAIAAGGLEKVFPGLGTLLFKVVFENFRNHVSEGLFQIGFVLFVFLLGAGLYYLRLKNRRLYANLEITFGVIVSWYAANSVYDATNADSAVKGFFAATAGLYVIVRGLDNWFYKKGLDVPIASSTITNT